MTIRWETLEPTSENMEAHAVQTSLRWAGYSKPLREVRLVQVSSGSRSRRTKTFRPIYRDRDGLYYVAGTYGHGRRYVKAIQATIIDGRTSIATVDLYRQVWPPKRDRSWSFDPAAQAAHEEAEDARQAELRAGHRKLLMEGRGEDV